MSRRELNHSGSSRNALSTRARSLPAEIAQGDIAENLQDEAEWPETIAPST
jgi:hypothetical protein